VTLAADPAQLRQHADALSAQGQYAPALDAYRNLLARLPGDARALYGAGLCLVMLGRNADAIPCLRGATIGAPGNAQYHADLGAVLSMLEPAGDAALASLDRALELEPAHASALANRGKVLHARGQLQAALRNLDAALAIDATHKVAWNNLGNVLSDLGRHADAVACFDRILQRDPDDATAHYNRGTALNALHRPEEAVPSLERALALRPDWPSAWLNLGSALTTLRRFDAALAANARVLALDPTHLDAMNNNGNVLRELKRPQDALAWLDRALALKPDFDKALYNRGAAMLDMKRFAEAADSFARLPGGGIGYRDAAGYLLQARAHGCDWTDLAALRDGIARLAAAGRCAAHPFPFLGVAGDPAAELAVARTFLAEKFPPAAQPVWRGEAYAHGRIRLAYLSADFHDHATAWLMAELFELHDRDRFELVALSYGPDSTTSIRDRLRRAFDRFEDIRALGDLEAAQLIRALEIDILVDLKGITSDARPGICALRPAPIQVSYLGYPGTLGMPYLDYIIADPVLIRPEDHIHYAEHVVTLPDSYQVNDRKRPIAENTPTRAGLGLPADGFVFCCFNNNYKILPDVFDVWMRLLAQVDGSVLWLIEDTAEAAAALRREAAARGIPADRLVFAPRVDLPDHLARQRRADLLLDTLPYNAHTTASDALWAGLPVLTCMGRNFAGRVAASLLTAVGLPELITASLPEYEALALRLAREPDLLAAIRGKLARNLPTAKLFDTPRFCRHLEAAYATMWQRQRRGDAPAGFAVPEMAG